MRTAYILALLVIALMLPHATAVSTTLTLANNSNFSVADKVYTIELINENGTLISDGQSKSILKKDKCLQESYSKVCLQSATTTQAILTSEFLGPILKSSFDVSPTTISLGNSVNVTVTLTNTGEQRARNAQFTAAVPDDMVLTSDDFARIYEWEGTVEEDRTIRFGLEPKRNGTFNITGTYTYFDGNRTQNVNLSVKTITTTIPISYAVHYNETASKENTTFSVNVTNKDAKNRSIRIEVRFPDEVVIEGTNRRGVVNKQRATLSRSMNSTDTKIGLEVYYRFTGPPTADALVSVTYENDSEEQTLTSTHAFVSLSDTEPSLAAKIDPMTENRTGLLQVIVTGNRTGILELVGIINQSVAVQGGTHEFVIPGQRTGNYSLSLSFTSIGTYGEENIAQGTLSVEVKNRSVQVQQPVQTNQTKTNQTTTATTQEEPEVKPDSIQENGLTGYVWIVAGAGICVFLIILAAIRMFSDPLHKLEIIAERIEEQALVLQEKKLRVGLSKQEEAKLQALQRELADIARQL